MLSRLCWGRESDATEIERMWENGAERVRQRDASGKRQRECHCCCVVRENEVETDLAWRQERETGKYCCCRGERRETRVRSLLEFQACACVVLLARTNWVLQFAQNASFCAKPCALRRKNIIFLKIQHEPATITIKLN